ncbi:TetR/AcrR family transcriptional regulator [Enterobacter sp. Cy-643]|uniref:TetR/AcrR family transcriptional regulator n=1 Tax=Enterobacter sp. Cy-643 TaxID=2608346 RepID=UPI00142033C7|nr:TetR/AcrR family transcriptional regulator [Enterobacter sp. Cy-643]NIF31976.1 TetR/AcrR family transcriptional regulator [Enterobacter sp. Cy-643]
MTKPAPLAANQPKRLRGHLRVAAITEAATRLFGEKGFDAVTMTEIAASSGTAIGSLYRFFPNKESLADALLLEYTREVIDRLEVLEASVAGVDIPTAADLFTRFVLSLQSQRTFALRLVEERGEHEAARLQFRDAMRGGFSTALQVVLPSLSADRAGLMTVVILQMLKGAAAANLQNDAERKAVLNEAQALLELYLLTEQAK